MQSGCDFNRARAFLPPGAFSKDNIICDVICDNSNHERNIEHDLNPSPILSTKDKKADMLHRILTSPDLPNVGREEKWENHNLSVTNSSYETCAGSNFTLNSDNEPRNGILPFTNSLNTGKGGGRGESQFLKRQY